MADAGQCRAPDGTPQWRIASPSKTVLIVLILACTPITVMLLGPKILFYVGRTLGFYLRKKTAGRKEQILQVTADEEKEFLAKGGDKRNSDDWETVETSAVGTAKNGEKAEPEWNGFVGFFHPFW